MTIQWHIVKDSVTGYIRTSAKKKKTAKHYVGFMHSSMLMVARDSIQGFDKDLAQYQPPKTSLSYACATEGLSWSRVGVKFLGLSESGYQLLAS